VTPQQPGMGRFRRVQRVAQTGVRPGAGAPCAACGGRGVRTDSPCRSRGGRSIAGASRRGARRYRPQRAARRSGTRRGGGTCTAQVAPDRGSSGTGMTRHGARPAVSKGRRRRDPRRRDLEGPEEVEGKPHAAGKQ
jgi:hypothetical protein